MNIGDLEPLTFVIETPREAELVLPPNAAKNIVRRGLPHKLTPLGSVKAFEALQNKSESTDQAVAKDAQDILASLYRSSRRHRRIQQFSKFGLGQNGVIISFPTEWEDS